MEKRKLVISTGNQNKVNEIREILKDLPIEVISKRDIGLGDMDVVENGKTLEENSMLKAKALANKTNYMVMADDSGLFVDKLNGEPGIYSSRYGGEEGNDQKNNNKLLKELESISIEDRKAKFISVIVLITESGQVISVEGQCKGTIGFQAVGSNGFGYDPLFTPEGFKKTFGELDENIKNEISHRSKALEKLKVELEKII